MPRKGDNACLHLWLNDHKVEYEVKAMISYDISIIQVNPS